MSECKECAGLKEQLGSQGKYLDKIRQALDDAQARNILEVRVSSRQITDLRNRLAESRSYEGIQIRKEKVMDEREVKNIIGEVMEKEAAALFKSIQDGSKQVIEAARKRTGAMLHQISDQFEKKHGPHAIIDDLRSIATNLTSAQK